MKILVITGSGRRKGTSAYLADEFIRGCRDAGNEVWRFDAAFSNIKPCMGCGTCRETDSCIWDDDFHKVASYLTEADEIVLATPVYYMGMTSQLKMVIDRMYQLESKPGFRGDKKYIVLSTAWDSSPAVFKPLLDMTDSFCRFLRWESAGTILAAGMDDRESIENSLYGKEAYELGRKQK